MKYTTIIILLTLLIISFQPLIVSEETNTNDLPSFFSWRDIDGIDYSTPVKNQAPAPTCEAYALCASLETILQYETKDLYTPDLSETHLYFYPGGTFDAGYVNIIDAANYLIDHGVPDEGCYPDPHRPYDYPYASLEGWENRTVKITEWGWVEPNNEAIKQALIDHGPLAACFYLYKDFNYYTDGIYKHKWGEVDSGHVMSIYGYDDENLCWIIKNSWGKRWGDNGWIKMDYDSTLFADWYGENTGIMYIDGVYGNIEPDVPKVYIKSPKIYHSYVFGNKFYQILRNIPGISEAASRIIGSTTIEVSAENTEKIEFYVDDQYQTTDEAAPFEWTTTLQKGPHTIETYAYDSDGDISMDILEVFVLL